MGCILTTTTNHPFPIITRDFHHSSISLLGNFGELIGIDLRDTESVKKMIKDLRNQAKQEEKKIISNIIKGQYSGDGIRKTKAYETNLTEQEYDEVKSLFWATKISEKESTWKILKIICDADYCNLFQ